MKNLQGEAIASNKKVSAKKKQDFSNGTEKTNEVSATKSLKRNSTVSYKLVERTALYLPNPVYTCDGYGKITIDIEVTETGRVKKATYNKRESTTKNECLIDNAIAYAKSARFTTSSRNISQEGTITYNFPGQQ